MCCKCSLHNAHFQVGRPFNARWINANVSGTDSGWVCAPSVVIRLAEWLTLALRSWLQGQTAFGKTAKKKMGIICGQIEKKTHCRFCKLRKWALCWGKKQISHFAWTQFLTKIVGHKFFHFYNYLNLILLFSHSFCHVQITSSKARESRSTAQCPSVIGFAPNQLTVLLLRQFS